MNLLFVNYRNLLVFLLLIAVFSCEPENGVEVCYNSDCWVDLYTDGTLDEKGYWHIPYSDRFTVHIESVSTTPNCQFAGVPYVTSRFDSSTYYEIEGGVSFTFGLYNPFTGYYSQTSPIKVKDTTVTLDFFDGTVVPLVQTSQVVHDIKDKMECYGWTHPKSGPTPMVTGDCPLYSKRIVGPVPEFMIGDTVKIYSETFFDCSDHSIAVIDSISVIIDEPLGLPKQSNDFKNITP